MNVKPASRHHYLQQLLGEPELQAHFLRRLQRKPTQSPVLAEA